MAVIIGIDPGITGALAVIREDGYSVHDLPIMANGKGGAKVKNKVDGAGLAAMLQDVADDTGLGWMRGDVYLERVSAMPGQGVSSMFSMGDTFGCIRGVCAALGYRVHIITPQEWKKHFGLGKDKEVVRAKAIEMFPEASLARKKDHNRSEALLIAYYGAMKQRGGA